MLFQDSGGSVVIVSRAEETPSVIVDFNTRYEAETVSMNFRHSKPIAGPFSGFSLKFEESVFARLELPLVTDYGMITSRALQVIS